MKIGGCCGGYNLKNIVSLLRKTVSVPIRRRIYAIWQQHFAIYLEHTSLKFKSAVAEYGSLTWKGVIRERAKCGPPPLKVGPKVK